MTGPAPLHVIRPDLPPLEEFLPALEAIWASRQLTNNGPYVKQLEHALAEFLQVPAVSLFCNATIALMAALRALQVDAGGSLEGGEVITTPFSFVASSHVLRWAGLTPVFVDIEPDTFTLDARQLAGALSERTVAILPVHVYGHPCDTAAIDAFAAAHGLQVLYDAAHAFGVRSGGPNLLAAGQMSVLSFHATKVFHTFEGGAVVCRDAAAKLEIDRIRNFGFEDEVTVNTVGLNGKMNELQAALGLLQLPRFAANTARRAAVDARYRQALAGLPGLALPPVPQLAAHNFGYFPLAVGPGFACSRDALYQRFRDAGILARRYFHPLISEFPMYRTLPSAAPQRLPVATRVARQVLCLPIFAELGEAEQQRVIEVVLGAAA